MSLFGGGKISTIVPKVTGIGVQTSVYGRPIPICFGTNRLAANLGWYGDFQAIAHEQSAGGKGGGGGSITSYSYQSAVDFLLCEGPIVGINRVWRNKDVLSATNLPLQTITVNDESHQVPIAPGPYTVTVTNAALFSADVKVNIRVSTGGGHYTWQSCSVTSGAPASVTSYSVASGVYTFYSGAANLYVNISYEYIQATPAPLSAIAGLNATLYTGTSTQTPPGYMTTNHTAQALGYQYTAHIFSSLLALTQSATLDNYSWEIQGFSLYSGQKDTNPSDVLTGYLTDANYGAGFPSANLGSLTNFSNYCLAQGILLSPHYAEQKSASEEVKGLMAVCNSEAVWSQGVLKIVPYGDTAITGALGSFTPNITPIYNLTDDDFLDNGPDGPIIVTRPTAIDAYNAIQIEFTDRNADYNLSRVEASDITSIQNYGYRAAPAINNTGICQSSIARTVAQTMMQRLLYIRSQFQFKISLKYSLLEPMDLVTLTDPGLGYNLTPVRILTIEEDGKGELSITAEEFPLGVHTPALYATQNRAGYLPNYNIDPGNTSPPAIIEPTDLLVSGPQIWMQASGGTNWGGCNVWVSTDDSTYKNIGTITGSGRQGQTTSALPVASSPDLSNTLSLQLNTNGTMASGSAADQVALHTLVSVDNEFIAYLNATLTGTNAYALDNLIRGAGGSVIAAHSISAAFSRWDGTQLEYNYPSSVIGHTIYFKLQSFNQYGGGTQTLDTLPTTSFAVLGTYYLRTPPDVTGALTYSQNGLSYIGWTASSQTVDGYEVRLGPTWGKGIILGSTVSTAFQVFSNGTYWVAAKRGNAYSANPVSVSVTAVSNPINVVQTWDEQATGWLGTLTGAATIVVNYVELTNTAGAVNTPGWYEVPAAHVVDLGIVNTATVSVTFTATTDSPSSLFSTIPLVSASPSIAGNWAGKGAITIQIATSDVSGTFGSWANFVPGQYSGRKFKIRVQLDSLDPAVTPVLTSLSWTVDMPDKIDRSNTGVACAAGGTAYTWANPFQIVPNVHVMILNMIALDTIVFPVAPSKTGVSVQITNAGVGVARTINIIASGY